MKRSIFAFCLMASSVTGFAGGNLSPTPKAHQAVVDALSNLEKRLDEYHTHWKRPLWMQEMFLVNGRNRLIKAIEAQEQILDEGEGVDENEELNFKANEAIEAVEEILEVFHSVDPDGRV